MLLYKDMESANQVAIDFVQKLDEVFLFPLIVLMTSIAFLVFIYGCAEYIMNANNDQARETGKRHILFGFIGLVVIMSAYALLNLALGTFGLSDRLECASDGTCENSFQVTPPGS